MLSRPILPRFPERPTHNQGLGLWSASRGDCTNGLKLLQRVHAPEFLAGQIHPVAEDILLLGYYNLFSWRN